MEEFENNLYSVDEEEEDNWDKVAVIGEAVPVKEEATTTTETTSLTLDPSSI